MMGKTKEPSLNKDESPSTATRVAAIDNPGESRHDTSAEAKEAESAAFQNILADIDSRKEKPSSSSSDKGTGDEDEQEWGNAEPAVRDEDIETTADEKPVDSDDSADDSLDEAQQKAFESIMAQIESDGLTDEHAVRETGDAPESEPADDLSAGPEKVLKEADTDDDAGPEDAPPVDLKDEESPPGSYDIEDILNAIASDDNDSPLAETVSDDSDSETAAVDASEKKLVDDDIVAHRKTDDDLDPPDGPQTATPARHETETPEAGEGPRVKCPSIDPQSSTEPMPAPSKGRQHPEPLRQASPPAVSRQKKAVPASVVATILVAMALALGGYVYDIPKNLLASKPAAPDTDTNGRGSEIVAASTPQVNKPLADDQGLSDQSRLGTAADNLDRLRRRIIEKNAEIGELRAYYQAGIDSEIQAIADKVGSAGKGKIPFTSAMADPSVSMGLSAIQRRYTYIKKLENPQNTLVRSSEALLFFSRKAALLALMAGKTSDIDIDGFIAQTDEVLKIHSSELARLNIDAVPASTRTLASIWQDIETRMPTAAVKPGNHNRVADTDNATIWKKICDGDFSQKHRLTKLSPAAARCLTAWKGKDLFLNALTDLSPDAARHLSAWEGDWLGLNGLTELSPEAAVHLSRWKGKGLSLNSLSSLSPRVVAILSDWQGDQIELVNLKHMSHWGNPKTRLFLSEDLKRRLMAAGK